jgi:Histidine phosphatase superfamily (branch 1)
MFSCSRDSRNLLAIAVAVIAALFWLMSEAMAQTRVVSIFIVRHSETDQIPPTFRLTAAGRQRAELLVHTFRDVKLTHIFAAHTSWNRHTLEAIAAAQALPIVQLPAPGSILEGRPVTDETSRRAPIEPIATALTQLPAGSVALAALNGENIFAILNRLGVPLAAAGQSCSTGSMCVPCTNNTCFPKEFDHIWYLLREPGRAEPLAFVELRYGAGWQRPSEAKKE